MFLLTNGYRGMVADLLCLSFIDKVFVVPLQYSRWFFHPTKRRSHKERLLEFQFALMKTFLAFAIGLCVLRHVELRPAAEEDPPRVLRIMTDSMSSLTFPYRACFDKEVTLRLTGGGGGGLSPDVIPCRDRVRRLVVDDDQGIFQLPRLVHLLPNVDSVVIVAAAKSQGHRDDSSSSSSSPSFVLKRGRLRHLELRDLREGSRGWDVLQMAQSVGVESLVVDGCDLSGGGTVGRLRQFLKHSSSSLEKVEFTDVEVRGSGQLAKVFQGLPEMSRVRKLLLRMNNADMLDVNLDLWRSVNELFPHLEELSTNLKVGLGCLVGLGELRVVRLFVDPKSGLIDLSFIKKKEFLEELVVGVFCKEPGMRVGLSAFREWPQGLRSVKLEVSRECDLSVRGWLSIKGSEYSLTKDPHSGDQVIEVRREL